MYLPHKIVYYVNIPFVIKLKKKTFQEEAMCHIYLLDFIYNISRRMFPTLKIKISGLEDDVEYSVGLEIRSVDCKRYRYVYQRWDVWDVIFYVVYGKS